MWVESRESRDPSHPDRRIVDGDSKRGTVVLDRRERRLA
ncbi:hypothetical protein CKA32_003395 [Geitlerinema sp. FC II]|nr:hypothetical protein CKA32_003395 [Geitlerinema sp. FC II]